MSQQPIIDNLRRILSEPEPDLDDAFRVIAKLEFELLPELPRKLALLAQAAEQAWSSGVASVAPNGDVDANALFQLMRAQRHLMDELDKLATEYIHWMDPLANIERQRELAKEIIAYTSGVSTTDDPAQIGELLLEPAAQLAELVTALDERRLKGGFDPYGPRFVIAGYVDDEDGTLYWSNDDGWVHLATATVFTSAERASGSLPLGDDARWVQLP